MLILLLERIEKTQRFSQWWLQVWLYFTWSNHYQISIIWQRILTQNLFSVLINHGKATPGLITLTHFLLSPFPTCLPLFCGCLCTLCHIINFKWWKNQATVDKNHWIFFFFFCCYSGGFIHLFAHACFTVPELTSPPSAISKCYEQSFWCHLVWHMLAE